MQYELRSKNILIVGGAGGIGYATAKKLLHSGAAKVVLASRNCEKLESAKNLLDDPRVAIFQFDITKCESHLDHLKHISTNIGAPIDGLVISSGLNANNQGWSGFNVLESTWDAVMNVNLKGPFFLTRTFCNYLIKQGVSGNICIISSISAHRDFLSVYQITKNAISGFVHAYGKHLYEKGIVLNCIEPGVTDGGMLKNLQKYTDGIRPGEPWNDNSIRRIIRPEEIAEVILFLMSEAGVVLCGSCVLAAGGCKSIARYQ